MITLDNLFTFWEFIAENNTYIQHQPGTTGTTNRFSRFTSETTTGQLNKLGFPRLEVVQLPFGGFTDYGSSQHDTLTCRVRVVYKLSDKFDYEEEITKLDNAKKALVQALNYINTEQEEHPSNSLLCAFDLNTARYTFLDKATFSGSAVGCELTLNFKQCVNWEDVEYGDFPEYNGTITLPTTNGNWVLKVLNGVYSWVAEAAASLTWGSITGTLSDQTDLQNALNAKQNSLGYTPENASNKSDSYTVSSSTTYASTKALVDGIGNAKSYADGLVVGLWDDRGSFDASGGAYPTIGGSGTGGAILKGDIWVISVAGTLPTGQVVEAGDTIRALIDLPGNTQANWAIQQNNIGYVPENVTNKTTTITGNESSTTLYSNVKGMVDWVKQGMTALLSSLGLTKATPVDADSLLLNDSADSNKLKLITFANIWEWIKSNADGRYKATLHCKPTAPNTTISATEVVMEVHAIPANTLNIYDVLTVKAGAQLARSAGTPTVRFGISTVAQTVGNAPVSGTIISTYAVAATRVGYFKREFKITDSTTLDLLIQDTAAFADNIISNSATVNTTVTIDRTNIIYMYVSMQMGTAGDVGTLKDFLIARTKAT